MSDPVPVEAERLTPEEADALRGAPMRTVRAREVSATDATPRSRWRGVALGVTFAVGAGLAAAVGYIVVRGKRKPRFGRKHG